MLKEKTFLIDNVIITNHYIIESFAVLGFDLSPTVGNFKKILKIYNVELLEFDKMKKDKEKALINE